MMNLSRLQLAALEHIYQTGLGYLAFDYERLPFAEYFDLYVRELIRVNEIGCVCVTGAGITMLMKAGLLP
jgi:hypothetical protein